MAAALAAAGLIAGGGVGGTAFAQAARTWVSGAGSDIAVCTRTAPCRTFAGAIGRTATGGEIDCLTPGDFGTVTIAKSLVISCNGIGNAGISVTGGDTGVTIDAGPGDVVVLDGLEIAGANAGAYGISFVGGAALIVRNTTIRDFVTYGIFFQPQTNATLNLDNTSLLRNQTALVAYPGAAASVRANISRSQLSDNAYGLFASGVDTTGAIFVSLRATTIANSTYNALYAEAGKAAYATIALDEVTVSGSGASGLYAQGARAGMLVNNTTITNNLGGGVYANAGGVIYSYGNNRVNGNNAKDGSFTGILSQR